MAKKITQEYLLKVVASGLKEVTSEIKTLNNNLTEVDASVEKTGKAFNSAGRQQDRYSKKAKGVGQLTNNQTKSFSKMAQGIQGTLVPAYATVAATVFALTAAFGALKRAADLGILTESAATYAVQTGRSLTNLSREMQNITNSSITMKESLESASIAASAGFDDTTIKNLTQVARNASVALGRDMTDSLNRVFKGAIKAEPELLDELGIILRLDPAARKYAAALGKSVTALTTFEKQQAVVNEVIAQGEDKFKTFSEVDVNPFTQLATAFADISVNLIQLISIPIGPVINFLADNLTALTAVIILFASSVLKKAFPALGDFAEVMEKKLVRATRVAAIALKRAEKSTDSFKRKLQGVTTESQKTLKTFSKGIFQIRDVVEKEGVKVSKAFTKSFKLGTGTVEGLTEYKKGIQGILAAFRRGTKVSQGFKNTEENVKFLNEELGETKAVLKGINSNTITVTGKMQTLGKGIKGTFISATRSVLSFSATLTQGAIQGALLGYTKGFSGIKEGIQATTAATVGFTRVAATATTVIAGLGGAFLKFIPVIGLLTVAWSILSSAFSFVKELLFGKELVDLTKTLDDNTEAVETAAKSAELFNTKLKFLPDTLDNIAKKTLLVANTMGTLSDKLESTISDIDISGGFGGFDTFLAALNIGDMDTFREQLDSIVKTMTKFGEVESANKIIAKYGELSKVSGENARNAAEEILKYLKVARDAARGASDLNAVLKESLEGLGKGLLAIEGGLPALTGAEQGFFNLRTILSTLDAKNVQLVASSIQSLTQFELRELGLVDIEKNITHVRAPLDGLTKDLVKFEAQLKVIQESRERAAKLGDLELEVRTEKTEKDFNFLNIIIKSIKDDLDGITSGLESQSSGIIKQLDKVKDRFQGIIDAQQEIAKIRSKNAISNLEQGIGLEKRLDALQQLTTAEDRYLKVVSSSTSESLTSIQEAIASLNKEIASVDITDSDKSGLIKELQANVQKEQQLENKLLKTRSDIVSNYIKQVKTVQAELSKTTKFAAAGLTVSKEQAKIVEERLFNAFLKIGLEQEKNATAAAIFAGRMTMATISAEKLNAFLQQARIPSTDALVSNLSALEARSVNLSREADFLAEHNSLLSERIDKEFILAQLENERITKATQVQLTTALAEGEDPKSKQVTDLEAKLETLGLQNTKLKELSAKTLKFAAAKKIVALKDEIKFTKSILDLGVLASKKQIKDLKIEKELQDLRKKGINDEANAIKDLIKLKEKQDFSEDFNKGISSMIEGMSNYSSIINELNNNLDNLDENGKVTASFKALSDIAAQSGDGISKGFADMGLLVDAYSEKLSVGTMTARDWSSFTMSALGAMSQLFEEGSSQAKALAAAQQVLAIVNAVASISNAASSGDPYTAPARVAHMLGLMSAVLGLAGIGLGGATGGDGGEKAYRESISEQGLVGQRDLQSNTLIDAIEGLVSIDTELFSSNRELQLTLVNLNKTFSKIGGALFGAGGTFEATNILDLFGITFGGSGGGNILSSRSRSNVLVDAGVELSAAIDLVGGVITSSLDEATFFLVESITTTKKNLFGSKSRTQLKTTIAAIGDELDRQLQTAIGRIGSVVSGLFSSFTNIVDLNLTKLFSGLGSLVFENIKVSLTGKDAKEQSESIAAFVSLLSNTLVERLLPSISVFSLAGEELLDTLIRITESIIQLESTFATLGVSLTSYIDTSRLNALDPNVIFEQAFGGADIDTSFLEILGVRFDEVVSSFEDEVLFQYKNIKFVGPVEKFTTQLLDPDIIRTNIEAAIEAMKITIVAAWEEAFLANFKDFDEFNAIFEKFSETLFTETERAQLALENAESTVNSGFELLRSTLEDFGNQDLLNLLEGNTEEALRAIFEMGNEIGAFAARFDDSTGEIDTSGADLLALIIQLGAAMGIQKDAAEDLVDVLDNLNQQYERQIATFGLLGKELDLLQLSFDFEDALIEAENTGTNIALVETYYGLQRLDIIRQYNQEIVDLIEEGMLGISDSILSVLQSAEGWDEIAFQSIRVTKLVDKLANSLGSITAGIDLSVFSDLSDTAEFLETLESFVDVTVGSGDSISDQILLIEELRTAVIARYEAEVSAAEDLESSINDSISSLKDLSAELGNFIDDLFVGDLSPLTNAQKLAEAQTQFDENLQNVLSQDTELAEAARADLLQSASTLLELADLFFAVGPEYQAIFNDVVGSLESIDQSILADIGLSEEALAINSLEESLTSLQLQTIEQLQTLDSILLALQDQNTINLNNELSNYVPQIIDNLDAITTKLDQVNNDSWNPILVQLQNLNSIMNNFTNISSFAKGSEEISFDQVAMIHKGETILTADTSKAIRSGESIYGVSDAIPTGNSSGDNTEVIDAIRILTQVVASGQEDMLEKNEEIIIATKGLNSSLGVSVATNTKGIV